MHCHKHNKFKLDCWYDCSGCNEDFNAEMDMIIQLMIPIAERIKRPISKVLSDLTDTINYRFYPHPKINRDLSKFNDEELDSLPF